jgi:hypothetical protein
MGKQIALVGLVVALLLSLGACDGDSSTTSTVNSDDLAAVARTQDSTPATAQVTVTEAPSPNPFPTTPSTKAAGSSTTLPTTTVPATTTSSAPPVSETSGYVPVPKPAGGARAVSPGGALTKHLAADIAAAFGFSSADVEAAIAEVELPPEAGGNSEGWLAPGTYELASDASPADVVQAMVDRRVKQLESRGVPRDQWYRTLTAASVIEKETYNQNEKPNVARVLTNRLVGGGPLQMDSIILYPVAEDRIFTTKAERDSDQPYNSYRHNGLPPTPICSPDEASIEAFLSPPPGDWWFYVTIDLHSGETRYAVTYEQHQTNVQLLRAWLRDNPTD